MYLNISSRVVRGDNLQLVRWPSSHSLDVQIDESFILSFILFYIEQEVGFENEQGGQIFCLTNQRESSKWAATGQESLLYLLTNRSLLKPHICQPCHLQLRFEPLREASLSQNGWILGWHPPVGMSYPIQNVYCKFVFILRKYLTVPISINQ